jgi:hypothetical protein
MATKTITVDLEACKRLKQAQKPRESFSQTIKRVVRPPVDGTHNNIFPHLEVRRSAEGAPGALLRPCRGEKMLGRSVPRARARGYGPVPPRG